MKQTCQYYECQNVAVEQVDIWWLCKAHAQEYKAKFKDALEAQRIKRLNNPTSKEGSNEDI